MKEINLTLRLYDSINPDPSLDSKCIAVLFFVLLILFVANKIKNTPYKLY